MSHRLEREFERKQQLQADIGELPEDYERRWNAAYDFRFCEMIGVSYWLANERATVYADNNWRNFE